MMHVCTYASRHITVWLQCEINKVHFSLTASRNYFAAFRDFFNGIVVHFLEILFYNSIDQDSLDLD